MEFGCNISSDTERRIRTNERARVVDYLQALGISAISRHRLTVVQQRAATPVRWTFWSTFGLMKGGS